MKANDPYTLDPVAVAEADRRLWSEHPELGNRRLTLGAADESYRRQWMKVYKEAAAKSAEIRPPIERPTTPLDHSSVVAAQAVQPCPAISSMTHEQKMEEAIKQAPLTDAARAELGDIKVLIGTIIVVSGTLMLIAATGYGAIAEGIGAALLLLGGAVSGYEIGGGIVRLLDFFNETRCDKARSPEDIEKAGKSFADAIAKMGIGGLSLVLGMRGARGRNWRGQKTPAPRSLTPSDKFFKDSRYTEKVKMQMQEDDFHGFPEEVTNHADRGTVKSITGGDGIQREMLEIPGEYKGRAGTFEFIKNPDGSINHRYFRPN